MPTGLPRSLYDIPTPALLLDLDVLEANLRRMARRCEALGVSLRPHVKTHKCVEVGERQRAHGARGITVSTLDEARAFVRAGFDDLTWAFPLVPGRAAEAARLAAGVREGRAGGPGREGPEGAGDAYPDVRLGMTVDSPRAVEALEELGARFPVWLKVDCGYGRAGVDPEAAASVELAGRIAGSRALDLAGILSHSGHAYAGRSAGEIRAVAEEERSVMAGFAARLRSAGLDVPEVSVGSTPSMAHADHLEGVTEVRPGNYALYDHTQVLLGSCEVADCAATVLATVVSSRPAASRSIVDAGALALSKDTGPAWGPGGYGPLLEALEARTLDPDAWVVSVSQEHGIVNVALPVGARARIVPWHSCLCVACFDRAYVVRGAEVQDVWRIRRERT